MVLAPKSITFCNVFGAIPALGGSKIKAAIAPSNSGICFKNFPTSAAKKERSSKSFNLAFLFASSMAWDIPRAILTSVLIVMTATPFLRALRRTYFKAAFLTPIEFKSAVQIKN